MLFCTHTLFTVVAVTGRRRLFAVRRLYPQPAHFHGLQWQQRGKMSSPLSCPAWFLRQGAWWQPFSYQRHIGPACKRPNVQKSDNVSVESPLLPVADTLARCAEHFHLHDMNSRNYSAGYIVCLRQFCLTRTWFF